MKRLGSSYRKSELGGQSVLSSPPLQLRHLKPLRLPDEESSKIQHGYHRCPACKANLDGGMIPVELRGLYDGAERYSRLIQKLYAVICPACRIVVKRREG